MVWSETDALTASGRGKRQTSKRDKSFRLTDNDAAVLVEMTGRSSAVAMLRQQGVSSRDIQYQTGCVRVVVVVRRAIGGSCTEHRSGWPMHSASAYQDGQHNNAAVESAAQYQLAPSGFSFPVVGGTDVALAVGHELGYMGAAAVPLAVERKPVPSTTHVDAHTDRRARNRTAASVNASPT